MTEKKDMAAMPDRMMDVIIAVCRHKEFSLDEMAAGIGIGKDKQGRKRLSNALYDWKRAGKLEKTGSKKYRYLGELLEVAIPAQTDPAPSEENIPIAEKHRVLWRLIRSRRIVSVEDMMELSGASRNEVWKYFDTLRKNGVIRLLPDGKYQLVKDSVGIPSPAEEKEIEQFSSELVVSEDDTPKLILSELRKLNKTFSELVRMLAK